MGVLNLTEDSFSDGGRFLDPETAVAHALAMEREGAEIIDIGAESTRPGAAPVPEEEELARVIPVLDRLRGRLENAVVSIDTSKAWDIPGVRLVLTGEMMATRNLAWMPALSYDTQAVLATDKVRFQGQEVACVIADDPYIAKDACEAIARPASRTSATSARTSSSVVR